MSELAVFWTAIGAVCALLMCGGAFVAFWTSLGSRLTAAELKAEAGATLAAAAQGKAELVAQEVANHREAVARELGKMEAMATIASSASTESERRLTGAIEKMTQRFDDLSSALTSRIDRLLPLGDRGR